MKHVFQVWFSLYHSLRSSLSLDGWFRALGLIFFFYSRSFLLQEWEKLSERIIFILLIYCLTCYWTTVYFNSDSHGPFLPCSWIASAPMKENEKTGRRLKKWKSGVIKTGKKKFFYSKKTQVFKPFLPLQAFFFYKKQKLTYSVSIFSSNFYTFFRPENLHFFVHQTPLKIIWFFIKTF